MRLPSAGVQLDAFADLGSVLLQGRLRVVSVLKFSLPTTDPKTSTTLLHIGMRLLLPLKQACIVAGIVPAHHQVLQAFILHWQSLAYCLNDD